MIKLRYAFVACAAMFGLRAYIWITDWAEEFEKFVWVDVDLFSCVFVSALIKFKSSLRFLFNFRFVLDILQMIYYRIQTICNLASMSIVQNKQLKYNNRHYKSWSVPTSKKFRVGTEDWEKDEYYDGEKEFNPHYDLFDAIGLHISICSDAISFDLVHVDCLFLNCF